MWLLKSGPDGCRQSHQMLRVHPPPPGSSKKQKEDFDLNLLQTCSLWSKADCLATFGPHSNCRDTVFRLWGWGEKWHQSGRCNRLAEDLSCLDVPCRKCTDNCWPVGWQVWPKTSTCWATPNHNNPIRRTITNHKVAATGPKKNPLSSWATLQRCRLVFTVPSSHVCTTDGVKDWRCLGYSLSKSLACEKYCLQISGPTCFSRKSDVDLLLLTLWQFEDFLFYVHIRIC